jgi:hypothetical protein
VALGHPTGARLLVAAAPDGAAPAAWVSHRFAWGTSGAPRALGGVDGTLFPSDVGATTGATTASFGLPPRSEGASQAVPRFFKFEFPTYDSLDDPLNWLNHCEQFFSG